MVDWCNVSCIQLGLQKFACILENITQTRYSHCKNCYVGIPPKQNMSNNKWHKLCSVHRLCWSRWSKTSHKVGCDSGIQQLKLGIPKLSTNSRTVHQLHLKLLLHDHVTWQVKEFITSFNAKIPQSKGAGTSNILTDCEALKKHVFSCELTCHSIISQSQDCTWSLTESETMLWLNEHMDWREDHTIFLLQINAEWYTPNFHSQFPNKAGDSKSNAQFSNINFDQLSARIKPMHKFRLGVTFSQVKESTNNRRGIHHTSQDDKPENWVEYPQEA